MRRVLCLEEQKQREDLEAVVPSVHEVAEKDVAGIRHLAARLKELEQIVELAMDVAANLQQLSVALSRIGAAMPRMLQNRGTPRNEPQCPRWWLVMS